MTKKEERTKLLLQAKAHILAEPKRLYMDYWMLLNVDGLNKDAQPPCVTAACIGGWMAELASNDNNKAFWPALKYVINLFPDRGRTWLFNRSLWPSLTSNAYSNVPAGSPARALLAANMIDKFIAEDQ